MWFTDAAMWKKGPHSAYNAFLTFSVLLLVMVFGFPIPINRGHTQIFIWIQCAQSHCHKVVISWTKIKLSLNESWLFESTAPKVMKGYEKTASLSPAVKVIFLLSGERKRQSEGVQILPFITLITFLNKNAPLNSSCIDILQYQFKKELWNRPVTKINFIFFLNKEHYHTNNISYK